MRSEYRLVQMGESRRFFKERGPVLRRGYASAQGTNTARFYGPTLKTKHRARNPHPPARGLKGPYLPPLPRLRQSFFPRGGAPPGRFFLSRPINSSRGFSSRVRISSRRSRTFITSPTVSTLLRHPVRGSLRIASYRERSLGLSTRRGSFNSQAFLHHSVFA